MFTLVKIISDGEINFKQNKYNKLQKIRVILFNIYMDGEVQEVNVRVLGKGLELLVRMVAGLR